MTTETLQSDSPALISWQREPRLLAFMPMLYVAWADGVLTEEELAELREKVQGFDWMGDDAQDSLKTWLNPATPPSASQLQDMLRQIRRAAESMDHAERFSLAELGLRLAAQEADEAAAAQARRAALELEEALGVVSAEAAAEIVAPTPLGDDLATPAASFDVEAMGAILDRSSTQTRQKIRAILTGPGFETHQPGAMDKEAYREQVLKWCQALADEGIGALGYPGVLEAASDDLDAFIVAFETIASFDLSLVVKFGVQFGLFGGSVYFLGTDEQRAEHLPGVASLALPGCFAMTEIGHGSNVRGLETEIRYDPDTGGFDVHSPGHSAGKDYIGNAAAHGRMATVFGQLIVGEEEHGVHAILVPIRDESGQPMPGVTIADCGHKMGLNGVDNGRLWFDHVHVPRANLLSRYGGVNDSGQYESPITSPNKRFFTMLGTLVGGRISVGLGALTASKVGLTIATRYGAVRRQFGPSGKPEVAILDYRAHQRRLMPRIAEAYALDFGLKALAQVYLHADEQGRREVEGLAAALKAKSTWFTTATLQECRECCGGKGYISANRFTDLKNDTDVFATFEGDNAVLLQLVARSRLTAFQRQFSDARVFSVFKYIARQASTALTELNPITTRQTDAAHLRDPEFHLAALRYREESLVSSLARRLKGRIDRGMDAFDAFNECQDHVLSLGKAYADRVTLEPFVAGIQACEDPSLAAALKTLCDLFALHTIEQDMGWFMENGYIEPAKARAIRAEVNTLCQEVRDQAVHYVNAFNIPERCVSSPIAPR